MLFVAILLSRSSPKMAKQKLQETCFHRLLLMEVFTSERFLLTPELECVCAGLCRAWHKAPSQWGSSCSAFPLQSVQGLFLAVFMGTPKAWYSCFMQSVHPLKYRKKREREVIFYCCSENVMYGQHAAF